MERTISTNMKDDGTLQIFLGDALLAEIENGKNEEKFVEDVLYGMGYCWNQDGTVTRMEGDR